MNYTMLRYSRKEGAEMKNASNCDCLYINSMAERFSDPSEEMDKLMDKESAEGSVNILKSLPPRRNNIRTHRDTAIEILSEFVEDISYGDKIFRIYMEQMHNALNTNCKYVLVYDRIRINDVLRSVIVFEDEKVLGTYIEGSDNFVPVTLYKRNMDNLVLYIDKNYKR